MKLAAAVSAAPFALTGCATGTKGPQLFGPDIYLIGDQGKFMDYSGSVVKSRFFQEATEFCTSKNRVMYPMNSTDHDSGYGIYASSEVQFMCFSADDLRVNKK